MPLETDPAVGEELSDSSCPAAAATWRHLTQSSPSHPVEAAAAATSPALCTHSVSELTNVSELSPLTYSEGGTPQVELSLKAPSLLDALVGPGRATRAWDPAQSYLADAELARSGTEPAEGEPAEEKPRGGAGASVGSMTSPRGVHHGQELAANLSPPPILTNDAAAAGSPVREEQLRNDVEELKAALAEEQARYAKLEVQHQRLLQSTVAAVDEQAAQREAVEAAHNMQARELQYVKGTVGELKAEGEALEGRARQADMLEVERDTARQEAEHHREAAARLAGEVDGLKKELLDAQHRPASPASPGSPTAPAFELANVKNELLAAEVARDSAKVDVHRAEQRIGVLDGKVAELAADLDRVECRARGLQKAVEAADAAKEAAQRRVDSLTKDRDHLRKSGDAHASAADGAREEVALLRPQHHRLQQELAAAQAAHRKASHALDTANQDLRRAAASNEELTKRVTDEAEQAVRLAAELAASKALVQEQMSSLAEARDDIAALERRAKDASAAAEESSVRRAAAAELEAEVSSTKAVLEIKEAAEAEAEAVIASLRERFAALQDEASARHNDLLATRARLDAAETANAVLERTEAEQERRLRLQAEDNRVVSAALDAARLRAEEGEAAAAALRTEHAQVAALLDTQRMDYGALQAQLEAKQRTAEGLQAELTDREGQVRLLEAAAASTSLTQAAEMADLQDRCRAAEEDARAAAAELNAYKAELQASFRRACTDRDNLMVEQAGWTRDRSGLQASVAELEAMLEEEREARVQVQRRLDATEFDLQEARGNVAELQRKLAAAHRRASEPPRTPRGVEAGALASPSHSPAELHGARDATFDVDGSPMRRSKEAAAVRIQALARGRAARRERDAAAAALLSGKVDRLREENASLEATAATLQQKLAAAGEELASTRAALDAARGREQGLRTAIAETAARHDRLRDVVDDVLSKARAVPPAVRAGGDCRRGSRPARGAHCVLRIAPGGPGGVARRHSPPPRRPAAHAGSGGGPGGFRIVFAASKHARCVGDAGWAVAVPDAWGRGARAGQRKGQRGVPPPCAVGGCGCEMVRGPRSLGSPKHPQQASTGRSFQERPLRRGLRVVLIPRGRVRRAGHTRFRVGPVHAGPPPKARPRRLGRRRFRKSLAAAAAAATRRGGLAASQRRRGAAAAAACASAGPAPQRCQIWGARGVH
eukprot:TRINITY_DN2248_c0_g2_i1.p1 TRINITY_DN2248_c0_g2~~TRINITY_DN2248_c0_g2_i1.p1  ORF type:complete len:1187 (+),score=265.84 TRINITY_DN2248_c0_g2_i1:74-3634(+)